MKEASVEVSEERKEVEKNEETIEADNIDVRDNHGSKKSKTKYKIREKGGDYLVEISGCVLNVFGQGALRFIDRPWNSNKAKEVTTVKFSHLDFNHMALILNKIKNRFPFAENFYFIENNIYCLGQLNALADIQGITSLTIERRGNPITEKNWRSYAIYRLSHWGLKTINNTQITPGEIEACEVEFRGLTGIVIQCLPENLLVPLLDRLQMVHSSAQPREWLDLAESSLRTVVAKEALQWRKNKQEVIPLREKGKQHLQNILCSTLSTVLKLQQLNEEWSQILREVVRDTLVDYTHLDSYMKKCISEIQI